MSDNLDENDIKFEFEFLQTCKDSASLFCMHIDHFMDIKLSITRIQRNDFKLYILIHSFTPIKTQCKKDHIDHCHRIIIQFKNSRICHFIITLWFFKWQLYVPFTMMGNRTILSGSTMPFYNDKHQGGYNYGHDFYDIHQDCLLWFNLWRTLVYLSSTPEWSSNSPHLDIFAYVCWAKQHHTMHFSFLLLIWSKRCTFP